MKFITARINNRIDNKNGRELLRRWLREESPFVLWMAALNTVCAVFERSFAPRLIRPDSPAGFGLWLLAAADAVFSALVLAFLMRVFLERWPRLRRFFKGVWLLSTVLLWPLDLFTLRNYQCRFDTAMLYAVLCTNFSEASEFLRFNIGGEALPLAALALLGVLALRWLLAWAGKNGGKKFWALAVALGTLAGVGDWHREFFIECLSAPVRVPFMLAEVELETRAFEQAMRGAALREISLTRNESSIPDVVFILGESTGRNHMQLYGYPLPTTPRLAEREKRGELAVFRDAITPHAVTLLAMEKIFTFFRQGDKGEWFDYPDLFGVLRQAGYKTAWLSNQESFGIWGRAARFFAQRCDVARFTMVRDSHTEIANYDERILPLLDDALSADVDGGKNFTVLHLMGTHLDYALRYPPAFNRFTARDEEAVQPKRLTERQRQTVAEYDNSVLYNDFIVDEIIRRFEERDAIVLYISDHGQEVYETKNYAGHYDDGNRYMLEIPMLVWASPRFRAARPELFARVARSVERPFMTDDMIHALLDLLGVETTDYDPTKSVFSDAFNMNRKRVVFKDKIYQRGKDFTK